MTTFHARPAKPHQFWRGVLSRRESFGRVYDIEPTERVRLVKEGVPAKVVLLISNDMAISKDRLYETIGLVRATVNRKLRADSMLSKDEGERVLGIAQLVGQVESIVKESGNLEGFDAAKWVAAWLERPHPALKGSCPAELMDTAEGRAIVSSLVAQMQSSAYA